MADVVAWPATDELPAPVLIEAGPFRLPRLAEADTPLWHRLRARGIGASEAGAVCNVAGKFNSPLKKFLEKTGQAEPQDDRLLLQIAKAAEGPISERLEKETGCRVVSLSPGLFAHPDHPWMLASPDLLTDDPELIGGEIKLFGKLDAQSPEELPPSIKLQCQQNMAVTGARKWWVAVGVFAYWDYNFEHFLIERDEELIARLIEVEAEFWDHVVARVRPDAYEGMRLDDVKLFYPRVSRGAKIKLSDDAARCWFEAEKLKTEIDEFVKPREAQREALRARVAYEMRDVEIGDLGYANQCVRRTPAKNGWQLRKGTMRDE